MDKGTFGESLKREREMRGVTLEEISAATRIAERFLKAIENDQWDQLPGGVFNRGFVRAMARYLGLDEENIVAEYALAIGDRPTVPVWTGSPPTVTPDQPWLAWGVSVLVILALLAGSWFGVRRLIAWRAARHAAQPPALNTESTAAIKHDASQIPPELAIPGTASDAAAAASASAPGTVSAASDAGSSATPASPVADRFELKVEAAKKTRIMITADKDVVYQGTIKAGENQFFSAADQFQISAKDAGALHLELNGKPIPPIGASGHSAKITLTRDSLKETTGGGN
ncbi:MAG TPA: RodZ domain-containing protein [Candidatus Acidoferrales bacterium]|jgi:cytoskeleton protein RodZ|nr:RodZ domain-containing protein [Candidatus Acidoferrales bacterium]